MADKAQYEHLLQELRPHQATLVAVSKTKPVSEIKALYDLGQRNFGENYVQELLDKQQQLPPDIRWHFIGHLQSNKVKYLAPFVHLIQGIDSLKLLGEVQKQAVRIQRRLTCLLQVHIASEDTKFGFDDQELAEAINRISSGAFPQVDVTGLMGMASFSQNQELVIREFQHLAELFAGYRPAFRASGKEPILSMGMSADYRLALRCGSNMVRIGSLLFGERAKKAADPQIGD